jgi:hypothetical protein
MSLWALQFVYLSIYLQMVVQFLADPVAALSEARALIACTLDREFESRLRRGCLSSSFYVVLSCVGRGRQVELITRPRSPTICRIRLGNQRKRGSEGPKTGL